jgi:hypothetical protein
VVQALGHDPCWAQPVSNFLIAGDFETYSPVGDWKTQSQIVGSDFRRRNVA